MGDQPVQLLSLAAKCYRAWRMYSVESRYARCDILFCGKLSRCGFCGYEITLIPRAVEDRNRARRLAGIEPSDLSFSLNTRWRTGSTRGYPSASSSSTAAAVEARPTVILTANPAWEAPAEATSQVPSVLSRAGKNTICARLIPGTSCISAFA